MMLPGMLEEQRCVKFLFCFVFLSRYSRANPLFPGVLS